MWDILSPLFIVTPLARLADFQRNNLLDFIDNTIG